MTRKFQRKLAEAGLPPMRWHDLRHAAASLMLDGGVPLTTVQDTLGHSTFTLTKDVYGHLTDDVKRTAADALDVALGSAN